FKNTATSMGYHPFPTPTGLISGPYTNQYGIPRNGCIYCGWCGGLCNYVCEVGAKSSSHVTTVPAALNTGKFDLRTFSTVYRIDLDNTGTTATGVRYYDAQGNTHIQPAAVVFNGIWGFNLTRLMLLSGVGNSWKQYDPVTVTGTIGRGLTNGYAPSVTSVRGTLNMGGNAYSSGNAAGGGYEIMDFADDNFDHTGQNFIGGAPISFGGYLGSGPNMLQTHLPSRTAFGSTWKASLKDEKLPSKLTLSFGTAGTEIPTKDWYIGLDPHYKDIYGDPLARITLDWGPNRWRPADYIAPIAANILQQMGCTNITTTNVPELSQHVDWWGHHMRGGCRMGANPATSAFNKWLQSWDVQNVFAASEICDTFGDNTTAGTHVAGMLSYLAADGIKKYLATPGQLA
ncbi:MAG: family oxidoreductase, partial [Thermoproteota archaeon]|nr:family oxidoreductase [Thermoproteota archaeon]